MEAGGGAVHVGIGTFRRDFYFKGCWEVDEREWGP